MLSRNLNLLYKSRDMDGFIIIPDFILESKELNHAQMILFWMILKLFNNVEKKCYTTDEELGMKLNSDSRTIRRNLNILIEKWYIKTSWTKMSTDGQKCPKKNTSWELRKGAKIIVFGQKCPSYIYNIYSLLNISSSKKEERNIKKEERNIKKEEMEKMLEVFRKDERLVRFMEEADVIRWWEHKQASKKPYKDTDSFIKALVKIKNIIKDYWWMPKADRNRRNRFNFAVNEAIERWWEWLNWYDSMEQVYESSKNDLYPNPKQNE